MVSPTTALAATKAPPVAMRKSRWRFFLSSARHGRRLMGGMLVEAPQCKSARRRQRGGVLVHALRFRLRSYFHLPQGIADFRRDAHAAGDYVRNTRNIGASAANQDHVGLLASASGCEVELQGTAHLLGDVVHEWLEHFGLIVAGQ